MKTDESLVKEYINGNEDAFRELTRRYLKPVFHFLARYVGNRTDAEDITQTAFINTWKHIRKFDQTKNFKTWLFAIARHAAIDFLKKKKHFVFSDFEREEGGNPLLDTLKDPEPLPPETLSSKESTGKLSEALDSLPPHYRATLSLHYDEHLTFEEIASVFRKPMNTVKSWHRRALFLLRKRFEEMHQ